MLMIVDDAALMPKVLISGISVPTGLTYIVLVKMPANSCTKLLLHHVPSSVLSLSGWATFLSRNQLSRHSVSTPPPLWMISSLTLSPSPFVLFHWPCMFQKQISFSSTVRPPTPPRAPRATTLLHYLLSKSKPCTQFLSKSTNSPPHCSTSSPTRTLPPSHPTMSSHAGI